MSSPKPDSPKPGPKKRGPKPGAKKRKAEAAAAAAQAERERELYARQERQREGSVLSLGSANDDLEPAPAVAGPSKRAAATAAEDDSEAEASDDELDGALLDDLAAGDSARAEEMKRAFAALMSNHFSEDQKDRYEDFRRSGFKPAGIRRLVNHVLQQSVSTNIVTAFRGLAKVYTGEVVEIARQVQAQSGQTGALLPEHIREAARIWENRNQVPGGQRRKLFSK